VSTDAGSFAVHLPCAQDLGSPGEFLLDGATAKWLIQFRNPELFERLVY
jgi:hypothetical protein